MNQPIPQISRADVARIAHRDFPAEAIDVLKELDEYGSEEYHHGKERVQLAVLKLAAGSREMLRQELENAKCDYRDVLSPAEYPGYTRKWFHVQSLPETEQQRLIEADWKQYNDWLRQ